MIHSGHREHPVRRLLDAVAVSGQRPSAAEIESLPVAEAADRRDVREFRARIRRAAEEIAELRQAGANGAARRLAAETAQRVADVAGEPVQTDPTEGLSPYELAGLIKGDRRRPAPPDLDAFGRPMGA